MSVFQAQTYSLSDDAKTSKFLSNNFSQYNHEKLIRILCVHCY